MQNTPRREGGGWRKNVEPRHCRSEFHDPPVTQLTFYNATSCLPPPHKQTFMPWCRVPDRAAVLAPHNPSSTKT